jgi:glycine/D-amino acid oxidase-like deaminating enzyme
VVVLEGARVGAGSSGRTGGIILEETAVGPLEGVTACIPNLQKTLQELEIECDLRIGGCWELAHTPEARSGAALWTDHGKSLVICDVVPGGTLDPGALLAGLAEAVLRSGGRIVEQCRVEAIRPGHPALLEHSRGQLKADQVVLALNAFTSTVVPELHEIRGALTFALCTEPLDRATVEAVGLGKGTPFYTTDVPYLWGRPLADGRIVFGGGLSFDANEDLRRLDIREGDAAQTLSGLETRVHRLHPLLEDVRIPTRWGGPVAFFRDRRPVLGSPPGMSNVLVTGGYAGHGIALGIRIGELVADSITGSGELPAWAVVDSEEC